jgi:tRNA/rRNA methyltransferase
LVLVSPKFSGNIGACARVAANFDIHDWAIVSPQCSWNTPEATKLATGPSEARLEKIRTLNSVQEAVADCDAAIGFTRRDGKIRKINLRIQDIHTGFLTSKNPKIALVFGNEESGLSASELESCTHLCSIPTSEAMPSMNLSHAIAVVLAQLYAQAHPEMKSSIPLPAEQTSVLSNTPETSPAKLSELESAITHIREFLLDIGMNRGGNPERILTPIRAFFHRSFITRQEIRVIHGVLSKAQVKLGTRSRGKRLVNTPEPDDSQNFPE